MDEITGTESASTAVVESASTGTETGSQGSQAGNQAVTGTPESKAYDPNWWKSDERTTKRKLWKTEADVTKSYFQLEPEYNTLKAKTGTLEKQISDISAIFKENGVEPSADQIKSVLSELKTFKDPNNLLNKRDRFLGYWLDEPTRMTRYGTKIDSFFTQLAEQELLDDHPGLTREQAQKQAALEAEVRNLKATQDRISAKENTAKFVSQIDSGIEQIKKYSEKVGFSISDEMIKEHKIFCMKNRIDTNYVFESFVRLHGEKLEKALIEKTKAEHTKELENVRKGTIPGAGSKGTSKSVDKMSSHEKLLNAVKGELG